MKPRKAHVKRATRETQIEVMLNLDGRGRNDVATGVPFLNHMLELFSRHALIDLRVRARGDLAVDAHHTVEDLGLCLGQALDQALGDRRGIRRYGCAVIPMDDALSRVVVDLGGRPYLVYQVANKRRKIMNFDVSLIEDFLQAFSVQARMNLHVAQLYGREPHHAYESVFKALARALRQAAERDPRETGIPSSKGML
ncbi:MAG: imidazoleglycerol-phosphate dehydratase HisB [Lentisphaerae bacterium]|nr:imidazoleglycerol-phosphate dehydratase HisB [Lentisphaerota bacterium]